jgi:hypothetical protein
MLSFAITALVCSFTALCYAEFAAMVPIAGSAYTYSYATLGELVAWIIGWDLVIEYAIGNVAVAISWANYFRTLLDQLGIRVPLWLATDYRTAAQIPGLYASAPHLLGVPIVVNVLAAAIGPPSPSCPCGRARVGLAQCFDGGGEDRRVALLRRRGAWLVSPAEMARNWCRFSRTVGTAPWPRVVVFFAHIG